MIDSIKKTFVDLNENITTDAIENFRFINNQSDLEKLHFPEVDIMYFDTEFYRRKTYWASLCLIQVKIDNQILLIDTKNCKIQNTIIHKLFEDEKILKVCHACEQDLQTLKHENINVHNCFDTQIGATFCKMGYLLSYQTLVNKILNISLDKTHQDSCWDVRPLTDEMLQYACNDVLYLEQIFQVVSNELHELNRFEWVKEEVINVQNSPKKKPMLHLWRDKLAQEKNIPPNWVIPNKTLHAISCETNEEKIREMLPIKLKCYLSEIVEIVSSSSKYQHQIDTNLQNALHIIIKIIAENENIPMNYLCTSEQLRFICQQKKLPHTGWRCQILKQAINNFLTGNTAIMFKNDKLKIC